MQMLLNGGTLDGTRLLGRKTVELMTADHLGDIAVAPDQLPPGHGFGLGFAVRLAAGLAPFPGSVGTYYWGGAAGTTFWVDPAERLTAVLMIQAPAQRRALPHPVPRPCLRGGEGLMGELRRAAEALVRPPPPLEGGGIPSPPFRPYFSLGS